VRTSYRYVGRERNLAITAEIVKAVNIPVMADGEDGFGDVTVIPSTIRDIIKAEIAGINLEDQILPNNIQNFSIAELRDCGDARVSLPRVAEFSAIAGMIQCLESIRDCNGFSKVAERNLVCSTAQLSNLMNN
jgi:2-methylisocitrate lyase-like PEP mutase family enzyme